jgi:endonuclease/exonuclease/phosphatase family metal-dependent hydrolase
VQFDAGDLLRAVQGRTYPAHRPHSQIDHILVSPRLEVLESSVLDDMGSDHRAVRAVLRATAPTLAS